MPTDKEEYWDGGVPMGSETQDKPPSPISTENASPSFEHSRTPEAETAAQFRFRILVVDDEPAIREVAQQILENGGYEVLTAADGLDGLHALTKSLPDLIISDLNMPRMSGFEFLAVVRERFPHVATIAVSAEYIVSGNPSGIVADTFLQKGQYAL